MKFPDFIIIGAMKCGTTALWRNLDRHPDVCMGKNPEDSKRASTEIRFWNNGGPHHTWRRGLNWYKSLFKGKCSGEKCANYVESPKAIRRMRDHIPGLKLVLCVREPVDRLLSEFWMHHFKPEKIVKFEREFVNERSPDVRSRYLMQLERSVLPYYPRRQIYIVIQERMAADTVGEMNRLFAWLGVAPYEESVVTLGFDDRDRPASGFRNWQTSHKVDMSPELRVRLREKFRTAVLGFSCWLGDPLPEWGYETTVPAGPGTQ